MNIPRYAASVSGVARLCERHRAGVGLNIKSASCAAREERDLNV